MRSKRQQSTGGQLTRRQRRLVQAILPEEPLGGYVVIYELPSAGEADRVGRELRTYLGGGTGACSGPSVHVVVSIVVPSTRTHS